MIVSKRGLLKIIILLAIIDVVAGFWYLTLRIENSGESRDFWMPDTVTETADTIADVTIPDSLKRISSYAFFVTRGNVHDKGSKLACIKQVEARIPVSINGEDSLDVIHGMLVKKAFGGSSLSFEGGMEIYTSRPDFNLGHYEAYDEVHHNPGLAPDHTIAEQVLVYPLTTSHRLMVWQVVHNRNNMGKTSSTSAYVHYDRVTHRIVEENDIVQHSEQSMLLDIINDKIDILNKSNTHLELHRAARLPAEFCVKQSGITFIFPPGEIAAIDKGEIEVFVPHAGMGNVYTPSFKRIVSASTGWWKYKPLP